MITPDGKMPFNIIPNKKTSLLRSWGYDGISNQYSFEPFGATVIFEKAIPMNRVEILGPAHRSIKYPIRGRTNTEFQTLLMRKQKINVKVEGSEDGENWQVLGKVEGVSAQADFQPISFSARAIKALRFTADTKNYSWDYKQNDQDGMLSIQGNSPHFGWRYFGPGADKQ